MRARMRGRGDDEGSILVMVLAISVLLVALLGTSLAATRSSTAFSFGYQTKTQSRLVSESGIAATLTSIVSAASSPSTLPCAVSGNTGSATLSYATTITYYAGSTALSCSGGVPIGSELGGSTTPTTATIVSTGSAPGGGPVVMEELLSLTSGSSLSSQYQYAMFTPGSAPLSNYTAVDKGASGAPADVYAGGSAICTNQDVIQGSLIVGTPGGGGFTPSSNCSITGDLVVNGSVNPTNNVSIGGNLEAIGGSIQMSSDATVAGNAFATNGSLNMAGGGSETIDGNAYVWGANSQCGSVVSIVLCTTGQTIHGNAYGTGAIEASAPWQGRILGTSYPNTAAGAMPVAKPTMPPTMSMPVLNPSVSALQAKGYTVIQIPNPSSPNPADQSCSAYFNDQYLPPHYQVSSSQFVIDVNAATAPTAIYAPTCQASFGTSVSGGEKFNLQANLVMVVDSLQSGGSSTAFTPSVAGATHDVSIIATNDAGDGGNITLLPSGGSTISFAPTLNVLLYTPGSAQFTSNFSMTGQILAGSGITTSQNFNLTYSTLAALSLPGTTSSSGASATPTSEIILKD